MIEIDQTEPERGPIAPTGEKPGDRDAVGRDMSAMRVDRRSSGGWLAVLLVLVGSSMQGYACGAGEAVLVAVFFLVVGIAAVSLVFLRRREELRTFLLTYGICVFVGGLAQCYSLAVFDNPQSTIDAVLAYYPCMSPQPPFTTMDDIPWNLTGMAGAILTWQQVYKLAWALGCEFGPYSAVMFNAFVMGLTGSVTVRTARELFGDDEWRLRRVGTLFALCGLFILLGSVLLRDCFTTFFCVLALWGIVRWLCRPTSRNLLFAVVASGIFIIAMMHLREKSMVMLGLFWFLALVCWLFAKRLDSARFGVSVLVTFAMLFGFVHLMSYIQYSRELQSEHIENTASHMVNESRDDSLAVRLVVAQPLPIRLVLGTGTLMVSPIPLWSGFSTGSIDGHCILGYNGIYQVVVLPLAFAGYLAVWRMVRRDRERATSGLFLAVYFVMNTLAVIATSLQQRHMAQFLPALMILMALPDTRKRNERKGVQTIAKWWFALVVLVHLAWAWAKQ